MKSQGERVKDAAAEFGKLVREFPTSYSNEEIATRLLEAADREPPRWPTDESVRASGIVSPSLPPLSPHFEGERLKIRAAMLADPIIKAAIAYRDNAPANSGDTWRGKQLIEAVKEAGL